MRAGAAARPEVEGGHLEEREVRLGRLDEDDVALEVRVVLVLADAELEARVKERAQHLVEDDEHALVGQRLAVDHVLVALGDVAAGHPVRERAKRVVTDDEVGAVLDGGVEVRRPAHAPVDVVDAFDARRLVEARQRRRRLDRFGNGERGVLVVAEHDPLGRIEVHGDDVELDAAQPAQHPEVVRESAPLDVLAEVALERRVVEETRGKVREREGELARGADGVDERLHALDQVRERRLAATLLERLPQLTNQVGCPRDEAVEETGNVRGEVDHELEGLARELGDVQPVELERRELTEVL